MTLTQGHGCDIDKQKISCLQDQVRTTQPITTKLDSYIPLGMVITWLEYGGILVETRLHRLDTVWTMWPWPFTSPMTLTFDFLRSNFKIAVSEELFSDWCETKKNQILGWLYGLALWPHPWPWPCSLKVKVWNSLIWGMGMGALIDMERKGCDSISHDHDCDLWVTMVGWVDVPYIDWGDYRRRRAVDISSLLFGYRIYIFILFIYFM